MSRSGTGLRIREPPVSGAKQGSPTHALRGATVDGVDIAHGGAPALGAQQPQRLGAGAQDRRPRLPLPPGPLSPQRRHSQAGARAAGDSEFGGDVRGGLGEFRQRVLGLSAGILTTLCSRVVHGLAKVGLTLHIRSGQALVATAIYSSFRRLHLNGMHLLVQIVYS